MWRGQLRLDCFTPTSQGSSQNLATTYGTGSNTFAVTSGTLPTGLFLNTSSGAITGIPTTTNGSPFAFTITATDQIGATASQGFTIAINAAPAITTTTLPASTLYGGSYSQTVAVSGGTGPDTFTVASGALPSGVALNTTTGVISGPPQTTSGSPFTFTISVTDHDGATNT